MHRSIFLSSFFPSLHPSHALLLSLPPSLSPSLFPSFLLSLPPSLHSLLPSVLPPFIYSVFLYCGSSIIKQHLTFIPSYLPRLSRHEPLISINTQTHGHTPSILPIRPAEKTVNIDSPFSIFPIIKLCSSTLFLFVCAIEALKRTRNASARR